MIFLVAAQKSPRWNAAVAERMERATKAPNQLEFPIPAPAVYPNKMKTTTFLARNESPQDSRLRPYAGKPGVPPLPKWGRGRRNTTILPTGQVHEQASKSNVTLPFSRSRPS